MDIIPSALSAARAIAYKYNSLTERFLQEAGASPITTYVLHRYALILAVIWLLIFVRPVDVILILHTPHQVIFFLIIFLIWNVQQFTHSYRINSTSTVSALSNLHNVLALPLLLLVGTYFNNDKPGAFSILAIAVLTIAMLIKPAHHTNNYRARFSKPVIVIVGFILLEAIVDVILIALARQLLKEVPPHVFIGVYTTLVLSACMIISMFLSRHLKVNVRATVRRQPLRSLGLPLIFFIGSIAEFYAQTSVPIYTLIAIGAITFIMDVISDLRQHRVRFNLQTIGFIILVATGISLAVVGV
jgi:hypothetical protein